MSRLSEHQEIVNKWKDNHFTGNAEQVNIKMKLAEIEALHDIGASLAILADAASAYHKKGMDDGK